MYIHTCTVHTLHIDTYITYIYIYIHTYIHTYINTYISNYILIHTYMHILFTDTPFTVQ